MNHWMLVPQLWRQQREHRWRRAVQAQMLMNRIPPPPPYHRELLSLSATLITEGRHELAVIVAQMACEVLVEQTLAPLIRDVTERQVFNVHAKETLKLYKKHTHDEIDKTSFWATYGIHAIRRHEVVHHGRRVSAAEAEESRDVATQFLDHVERMRADLAGGAQR